MESFRGNVSFLFSPISFQKKPNSLGGKNLKTNQQVLFFSSLRSALGILTFLLLRQPLPHSPCRQQSLWRGGRWGGGGIKGEKWGAGVLGAG